MLFLLFLLRLQYRLVAQWSIHITIQCFLESRLQTKMAHFLDLGVDKLREEWDQRTYWTLILLKQDLRLISRFISEVKHEGLISEWTVSHCVINYRIYLNIHWLPILSKVEENRVRGTNKSGYLASWDDSQFHVPKISKLILVHEWLFCEFSDHL